MGTSPTESLLQNRNAPVAMLSSVLRSDRAVKVNVEIMRTFVRHRRMLAENVDLSRQLAALEQKYDEQFRVVFDAIRQMMTPASESPRPMGFHAIREQNTGSVPNGWAWRGVRLTD